MEITSSYDVELRNGKNIFTNTIKIYREALAFLIDVFFKEWDTLSSFTDNQKRFRTAESMIHNTKANAAKYDFDAKFYKMPSYFRRAVTQDALGCVSSFVSNHVNWEAGGKKGREPKLQAKRFSCPAFYYDNMYKADEANNIAYLKLFVNNDWVFVPFKMRKTDVNYLRKYWSHCKPSAPTLEKRFGKYYLRFAYTENVKLSKTPIEKQRICAVDLGLNSDAVCSIMTSDGTILNRKFINFPSEKDHLNHVLNRVRRYQREHGSQNVQSFWKYAQRLNDELAKKIASAITEFAVSNFTDCIVFEHLNFRGKKAKGSKKQKLQVWRKNGIQAMVGHKAHRCGIRISHICAWGTSKLAFDGSGEVVRDNDNRALCTFTSGKRYNCDLSASYNIGARYFIRALLNPIPEKERSELLAKVPDAQRRTSNTLSTLHSLNAALRAA